MEKLKAKSMSTAAPRVTQRWHAVSLLPKGQICEAGQALRGKRFLSSDAPRFPVPACSRPHACPCAYRHHADRRGGPRRAEEAAGLIRNKNVKQERRKEADRRRPE